MSLARRVPNAMRFAAPHSEDLTPIGDMAREFDVSARALRFYEDRGLLAPLRQGAARLYTRQDRERLQMILKGKRLGFTLSEIAEMLARGQLLGGEEGAHEIRLALPAGQILAQIEHLERQRRDIDDAIAQLRDTHAHLAAAASHVG